MFKLNTVLDQWASKMTDKFLFVTDSFSFTFVRSDCESRLAMRISVCGWSLVVESFIWGLKLLALSVRMRRRHTTGIMLYILNMDVMPLMKSIWISFYGSLYLVLFVRRSFAVWDSGSSILRNTVYPRSFRIVVDINRKIDIVRISEGTVIVPTTKRPRFVKFTKNSKNK